ncbi:MAG TPA: dipeptide epimerase [Rubrobacter sp.]|nr:dipeptide epimerase [Rubrobacter sp.]
MRITGIEIVPIKLPLLEPFVVSYGTFPDLASVLVQLETNEGLTGWGEGTPDPHVTGETFEGVVATLRHLAPALLGRNPLDRSAAMQLLGSRIAGAPAAKAALDIALHDLAGRVADLPVWALLGGRAREALSISRVVSLKSPEAMALDARQHVAAGFGTVKLKIGDASDIRGDVRRVAAVREAIGPDIGIKIDVNGGWHTAGAAVGAARGIVPYDPEYLEQPVGRRDLEGMAEVRRLCGVPVMADEAVLDARDALRAVRVRACDLINIKLMKCGGLLAALALNTVAETAGVGCQIGTMVESSVASAAGLHLALALHNAATVEMGGPIMLAEDVGGLRAYYEHDRVTVPDSPGLGVEPDEAVLKRYAGQRDWITA